MFKIFFHTAVCASAFVCMFSSCKKDDDKPAPFVFYSVEVNGNDVTFTNKSTGAISYKWDFGDGTESTDESPLTLIPVKENMCQRCMQLLQMV